MAKQKLTTEEILAKARREGAMGADGAGGASDSPPAAAAEPEVEASGEQVAEESSPAPAEKPAAKPSSTADILAAARAQAAGGAKKPAASKPAAKPGSTSDILAAARSQGSGGGAAKPAAKKPAAKPGSTADILAAARAGGKGAAKPSPKSAGEKAAPKQPAAARPAGDRPSVQEMVKAARAGAPVVSSTAPAKPRLPSRPPLPAKSGGAVTTRRSFFGSALAWVAVPLTLAWVAMGGIATVFGLAAARFMMPNMIVEPPTKFKIGPPSDYPPGTVSTKWKAARGIWVVNTDQYDGRNLVYALASVCTHLGCTPNWLEGEQKFKCPCHGSGFYISGINFEGPAPRPLERVGLRVAEDGSLEVDKSVKFQEELGQWQDPASYVELV